MTHSVQPYGQMPDGRPHMAHVLDNGRGMRVMILEYGAILHRLIVPDRKGAGLNVTLGQPSLDACLAGAKYVGAIVGRVANRIAGAAFNLDGVTYTLEKNAGDLCLHSASARYSWRLFQAEDSSDAENAAVTLRLNDRGEGGMPGTVAFSVRYALDASNRLHIEYIAVPSRKTPISVTSHAYFNLRGCEDECTDEHLLRVNADYYLPNYPGGLPTGEVLSVQGTRFDLRKPILLGERLGDDGRAFDNNFCINGCGMRFAASAFAPSTGVLLKTYTDMPGMQLLATRRAFCFETQHYPNAVNYTHFPSSLYSPSSPFHSETVFAFSALEADAEGAQDAL